jgi:hypothetical protein
VAPCCSAVRKSTVNTWSAANPGLGVVRCLASYGSHAVSSDAPYGSKFISADFWHSQKPSHIIDQRVEI